MRINILWIIPPISPFAFVLMVRALWALIGLPWQPSEDGASFLVLSAFLVAIGATAFVGLTHSEGIAVWVNFKRKD